MSLDINGDSHVHVIDGADQYIPGPIYVKFLRAIGMTAGNTITLISASGPSGSEVNGGYLVTLENSSEVIPIMKWLEGIKCTALTDGTCEVHA